MASNLELPFFFAVSTMEWIFAKISAPSSVLKHPLTFCFILTFLMHRSLALLSYGTEKSSRKGEDVVFYFAYPSCELGKIFI